MTGDAAPVPRYAGALLVLAVFLLPAWGNRGPSSSSLADLVLLPLAAWVVVDALRRATVVRTPYLLPAIGLVTAGLVAGAGGRYPGQSLQAVGTDVYLLLVALAVTRVVTARGDWGRTVALAWVSGALVWSVPLLLSWTGIVTGSFGGVLVLSDGRAFGTFANPNLAGSYFAVSLFVALATLRSTGARVLVSAALLAVLFLTGSMAALIGTATGLLGLAIRALTTALGPGGQHRSWAAAALALAGLTTVVAVGVGGHALAAAPSELANSSTLHDSFGRLGRSDTGRFELWSLGVQQLGDRTVVGVGPGAAAPELRQVSDGGKSLHSDILASLLERGALGALSLILLVGLVGAHAWQLGRRDVPWLAAPAILAAAALSLLPALVTHEVLHFRHVWLLLGLLAGARLAATPTAVRSRP